MRIVPNILARLGRRLRIAASPRTAQAPVPSSRKPRRRRSRAPLALQPLAGGLPPDIARTTYPYDDYILAHSTVPTTLPEDDLFAGVVGDDLQGIASV